MDLKILVSFDKSLIFNGKWLYILLPEHSTAFCTNVKFAEGKCKLWLKRVFKSWISELDWNRPLFLLTKISNEKMYWDGSESTCNCLNGWQHESWLAVFVMILIIFFFPNAVARMWITPKYNNVWHDWMYIMKIGHSQYINRQKMFYWPNSITSIIQFWC